MANPKLLAQALGGEQMPFFNPDMKRDNPQLQPWTGSPAEVYNMFRQKGWDHAGAIQLMNKYLDTMKTQYPDWYQKYVPDPDKMGPGEL